MVGMTVLVYVTFLKAFFDGGSVVVYVDLFGEAWFEFILFPLGLFMGLFGVFLILVEDLHFRF